jgi:hypothetical protein
VSAHRETLRNALVSTAPPLDRLSIDFTGREREMTLVIEFLETVYDDLPTRCALHGMHGVEVSYGLANQLFDKGRYRNTLDASHHNGKAPSRLLEVAQARIPSSVLFHR